MRLLDLPTIDGIADLDGDACEGQDPTGPCSDEPTELSFGC